MIKRIIEISSEPAHLAVKLDQLLIVRQGEAPHPASPQQGEERVASIPCEDIGMVVVDHPQTTFSLAALARLMDFGAAVVVCGRDHLPNGLLLPMSGHTEVVWRLDDQLNAPKPVLKGLWKQIVAAKVKAQAREVGHDAAAVARLRVLAAAVRSGDPANVEAQAAKVYWAAWAESLGFRAPRFELGQDASLKPQVARPFGDSTGRAAGGLFHRDPDGADGINGMLNYGYAVLRAAVGRALVSAGLMPAIGMHHCNRSNAFCLADDLVEPLRPMVDGVVRELARRGRKGVDRDSKAVLLGVLFRTVEIGGDTGPLMVALHRYTASLVRCYRKEDKKLMVPTEAGGGRPDVESPTSNVHRPASATLDETRPPAAAL